MAQVGRGETEEIFCVMSNLTTRLSMLPRRIRLHPSQQPCSRAIVALCTPSPDIAPFQPDQIPFNPKDIILKPASISS